jgi:hypothetical protein
LTHTPYTITALKGTASTHVRQGIRHGALGGKQRIETHAERSAHRRGAQQRAMNRSKPALGVEYCAGLLADARLGIRLHSLVEVGLGEAQRHVLGDAALVDGRADGARNSWREQIRRYMRGHEHGRLHVRGMRNMRATRSRLRAQLNATCTTGSASGEHNGSHRASAARGSGWCR